MEINPERRQTFALPILIIATAATPSAYGCLIPAGLLLYEIAYLAATNRSGVAPAVVGCI
jgi:hypothetical protein